jgi:hypothetical protein
MNEGSLKVRCCLRIFFKTIARTGQLSHYRIYRFAEYRMMKGIHEEKQMCIKMTKDVTV